MRDMNRLVRTATSQFGLLTTAQLRDAGVTKARQEGLVRHALLQPVRRGVMRLAGAQTSWEQDLLGVILAPGAPLVASHRSALRLHGLRTRFDGLEVSVRLPGERSSPGVTVHRSVDLEDGDATSVAGIAVTTPARTLCDAGLIFPEHEVQRLVDHAVATDLVTPDELLAVRRRVGRRGRNGVVKLESAVGGLPLASGSESGPEVALLRLLLRAGLPEPVLQYDVRARAGVYRLDLAYPAARLGLEYDGIEVHTRVERFVADRRRQNDLVELGWIICRYTHEDLRDRPEALVSQIRRHLRHPSPPSPPRFLG